MATARSATAGCYGACCVCGGLRRARGPPAHRRAPVPRRGGGRRRVRRPPRPAGRA
jgi:hypothetical protein